MSGQLLAPSIMTPSTPTLQNPKSGFETGLISKAAVDSFAKYRYQITQPGVK
jgi:hypothetical protein